MTTHWAQKEFSFPRKLKGCYLVTDYVLDQIGDEISKIKIGTLNLFAKHTSCALTMNENFDPDVRKDMDAVLDHIVPYDEPYYEGPDDLPGHIKASLFGPSLTIPIKDGRLNVGTWQGIYLCEFREYQHVRKVVATINGLKIDK